eukprot:TRINITY_DN17263_c1_g1_i1.p1 TRINITY_DN17263_c1_g1~~TRINITY_DN17263_c1_g1_i1.p1  ORF type:complete len:148 (+),score=34.96 TRINITY_DN17263_c1_g1_i1:70-513(+)
MWSQLVAARSLGARQTYQRSFLPLSQSLKNRFCNRNCKFFQTRALASKHQLLLEPTFLVPGKSKPAWSAASIIAATAIASGAVMVSQTLRAEEDSNRRRFVGAVVVITGADDEDGADVEKGIDVHTDDSLNDEDSAHCLNDNKGDRP